MLRSRSLPVLVAFSSLLMGQYSFEVAAIKPTDPAFTLRSIQIPE